MKRFFQSNSKIYCLSNVFVCILCTGYLCTGYCNVNNEVQLEKTDIVVEPTEEPLSVSEPKTETVKPVVNKTASTKTVTTTKKSNTSSKTYVKASYDSLTGDAVVNYAKKYLGLRYVSGGNSLSTGTDCSGFTKLIYAEFGIKLSRTVKQQAYNGSYVKKSDLQKGDLVFYGYNDGKVHHVAIYIGNGKVIHESTPKGGVKISSLNMMEYITARRVITKRSSKVTEVKKEETPAPSIKEETNKKNEENITPNATQVESVQKAPETNNVVSSDKLYANNNVISNNKVVNNNNVVEEKVEVKEEVKPKEENSTQVETKKEEVVAGTSSKVEEKQVEAKTETKVEEKKVETKTYTNSEYGTSN